MKLSDIKHMMTNREVTIKKIENPYGHYYTLHLQIPEGLTWTAGQYAFFTLKTKTLKGGNARVLSIASLPTEGEIWLGTQMSPAGSEFKQELLHCQTGDTLMMRGPMGGFPLKSNSSPLVLIAGDLGIVSLRSLLQTVKNDVHRPIHLLYASSDYFLYKDYLENLSQQHSHIQVHYIRGTESEDLLQATTDLAIEYSNQADYYLSGLASTVKTSKKVLKAQGILTSHIFMDIYKGL